MAETIVIPFTPRKYQRGLIDAIDSGKHKRAFALWHRRAGKDICLWNLIIKKAIQKTGLYYYLLPTYTQAKKIIWDGINNDGFRFLDYCPKEAIESKNSTELKITLRNGSIIQLIGTDAYDAIRGTNPVGVVFSEYAFQNPMAWEIVKPILRVNGGWAVFNTTPNGKNHAYDLYKIAKEQWFCEKLTIEDTEVLTIEDIRHEREEGMTEEMIRQEYYCSFDIGRLGAYYSKQLEEAKDRICNVPWEKDRKVNLYLDLGRSDSTAIIFGQDVGLEMRNIDYYEKTGEAVEHYVQYLRSLPYDYGIMWLPHDGFHKRLEAKKSVAEQFTNAGFEVSRVPNVSINNGIQETRKLFKLMYFDKVKCSQLIAAVGNYHRQYDEVRKVFRNIPFHDWSTHGADALRYRAVCRQETVTDDYDAEDFLREDDEHPQILSIPQDLIAEDSVVESFIDL